MVVYNNLENSNDLIIDEEKVNLENCTVGRPAIEEVKGGGITFNGFRYHKSGVIKNGITYYRCSQARSTHCPATLNLSMKGNIKPNDKLHNHLPKRQSSTEFAGKKLVFQGFSFYKHGKTGNKIHWRCSKLCCAVRLHTDFSGNILSVRGEHKHKD